MATPLMMKHATRSGFQMVPKVTASHCGKSVPLESMIAVVGLLYATVTVTTLPVFLIIYPQHLLHLNLHPSPALLVTTERLIGSSITAWIAPPTRQGLITGATRTTSGQTKSFAVSAATKRVTGTRETCAAITAPPTKGTCVSARLTRFLRHLVGELLPLNPMLSGIILSR